MNYFEQQLHTFLGTPYAFKSTKPVYAGRAAFLMLSDNRRARIEFVTCGIADNYEALRITILDSHQGKIDTLLLRFKDYCATRKGSCSGTYAPHIWVDRGCAEWYGQGPTSSEISKIATAAHNYIMVFA